MYMYIFIGIYTYICLTKMLMCKAHTYFYFVQGDLLSESQVTYMYFSGVAAENDTLVLE